MSQPVALSHFFLDDVAASLATPRSPRVAAVAFADRSVAYLARAIALVRALLSVSRMHPTLLPYVDPPRVRWRYVAAGGVLGAALLALASRVVLPHCHGETREDIARSTAKKLAFEAYPQWRATFWNGPTCPVSLDALLPWMNNKDTLDPWGSNYTFWCGRTASREPALHVLSAGPDRQIDTADDIGSDL